MASLFTKIIQGEIPCHKIDENEHAIAFLDINPLHEGHCLVVPKKEVDYLFDLDGTTYAHLWNFAKETASKIRASIPCKRIGVAVIGLEVPHAHIHLIPLQSVEDINFSRPKLSFTQAELAATAERIRNN